MKSASEWSRECARQFGYGVNPDLVNQIRAEALWYAAEVVINADGCRDALETIRARIRDIPIGPKAPELHTPT